MTGSRVRESGSPRPEAGDLPEKLALFRQRGCALTARRIFAPKEQKFYTCKASGIFPVGGAAG